MPALLHPMPAALSRVRLCACLVAALMLMGCMGGTIAQQVARSVAMQVADKALDHALDEPKPQGPGITNNLMMSSSLDPYQRAFLQAELPTLPAIPETPPPPPQPEPGASATPIVTRLATVQVWSVLLGDEKPKRSPMQWPVLRSKSRDVQKQLAKDNKVDAPAKGKA